MNANYTKEEKNPVPFYPVGPTFGADRTHGLYHKPIMSQSQVQDTKKAEKERPRQACIANKGISRNSTIRSVDM